uniref:Uncharacterized protein n=1 Tax=Pithovirus LCDPAC02 TaxID=2506601 RepID=A0A481YP65_9VIRU|nr:MAG: hypothetical protein LCDPAC02_02600 [Pithovirus LCDPAC02]
MSKIVMTLREFYVENDKHIYMDEIPKKDRIDVYYKIQNESHFEIIFQEYEENINIENIYGIFDKKFFSFEKVNLRLNAYVILYKLKLIKMKYCSISNRIEYIVDIDYNKYAFEYYFDLFENKFKLLYLIDNFKIRQF